MADYLFLLCGLQTDTWGEVVDLGENVEKWIKNLYQLWNGAGERTQKQGFLCW